MDIRIKPAQLAIGVFTSIMGLYVFITSIKTALDFDYRFINLLLYTNIIYGVVLIIAGVGIAIQLNIIPTGAFAAYCVYLILDRLISIRSMFYDGVFGFIFTALLFVLYLLCFASLAGLSFFGMNGKKYGLAGVLPGAIFLVHRILSMIVNAVRSARYEYVYGAKFWVNQFVSMILFTACIALIGLCLSGFFDKEESNIGSMNSYGNLGEIGNTQNRPTPSVTPTFCGNCGSKLGPGAKFCNNCGNRIM